MNAKQYRAFTSTAEALIRMSAPGLKAEPLPQRTRGPVRPPVTGVVIRELRDVPGVRVIYGIA